MLILIELEFHLTVSWSVQVKDRKSQAGERREKVSAHLQMLAQRYQFGCKLWSLSHGLPDVEAPNLVLKSSVGL